MLSATGKGRTEMLTNSAHEAPHKILERNVSSRPTAGAELDWYPPIAVISYGRLKLHRLRQYHWGQG